MRVGGLYLYERCRWELLGPGLTTGRQLVRVPTRWFEGPLLPIPDSQRAEDYPQDMTADIRIAADASLGVRRGRVWTSEGAHAGLTFVVGELPEVVEDERAGDPVAVEVKLPVTINGRIFPREDVDVWSFAARRGQPITCEVHAARLGSPLDSRLEVRGPDGRVVAENDDARGTDSLMQFMAPADGTYQVRIHDSNRGGGQAFVYRLTVTAEPFVTHLYPLGGRRGTRTRFHLGGAGLPRQPVEAALPQTTGVQRIRLDVGGKRTPPTLVDVDDLPEVLEDDSPARVASPCVLNGRIGRPGEVDTWHLASKKGEAVQIDLRARALGSPLRGVLEIADAAGRMLRVVEAPGDGDPSVTFTVPADGVYRLRVRDRFRSRGGPTFAYRLRVAPPAPDFDLELSAAALSVFRGQKAVLRLNVIRRGGFVGPVALAVDGLPTGVQFARATAGVGQPVVNLTFAANAEAPIAVGRVRVRGKATVAGQEVTRVARLPAGPGEVELDDVLVAAALPAPFRVIGAYDLRLAPRGSIFRKRYKVQRNGYAGPLEVRLADRQARHLQGVTGPVVTVPAGVDEFEYPVTLPPWMETGRTSRTCVMAVGRIRLGDAEHVVSYTSQAQNDQVIAVVETGRLGLELGRASVALRPGAAVDVPVRIRRGKGLAGAVQVELIVPAHVRGITAAPLTIGADRAGGTLRLSLPRGAEPATVGLIVRATVDTAGGKVTAEAALQVVAGE